jgi:hypothetical protein
VAGGVEGWPGEDAELDAGLPYVPEATERLATACYGALAVAHALVVSMNDVWQPPALTSSQWLLRRPLDLPGACSRTHTSYQHQGSCRRHVVHADLLA